MREEYPTVKTIPESILPEVLEVNKQGIPILGITAANNQEFSGVVSLEDYLKTYPPEAEVKAWQVKAKRETPMSEAEITDERLGYKNEKVAIGGW